MMLLRLIQIKLLLKLYLMFILIILCLLNFIIYFFRYQKVYNNYLQ